VIGGLGGLLLIAVVFGVVNAVIKPIVKFFTFPFILLTLGLFTLVINALMLLLTAGLLRSLSVDGLAPAFWGGVLISIVSFCLSAFLKDGKK
jgi:putative membrane protein